jgi:hypothetical protein
MVKRREDYQAIADDAMALENWNGALGMLGVVVFNKVFI